MPLDQPADKPVSRQSTAGLGIRERDNLQRVHLPTSRPSPRADGDRRGADPGGRGAGDGSSQTLRSTSWAGIEVHVFSAGNEIIPESRKVAPYEGTFATMRAKEPRSWTDTLKVPSDFRKMVAKPYDLGLIRLRANYLKACDLDAEVSFGGRMVLSFGSGMAKRLPSFWGFAGFRSRTRR